MTRPWLMSSADLREAARLRFIAVHPGLLRAAMDTEERLRKGLKEAGITGEVHARAKDIASFVKKIQTKSGYATDPWGKVTDKVGARIIVDSRADLRSVADMIKAQDAFTVLSVEDKRDISEPSRLSYLGTHIQVMLGETVGNDGEPIECEIQVRTRAEDLWSVPSHKLMYKPVVETSPETQRRLWRLLALVELFDEEVTRALNEVESAPEYESARLLMLAESQFLRFVVSEGDRALSLEVLEQIVEPVGLARRDNYPERLKQFVSENEDKLSDVYAEYGSASVWAGEFNYWLFTQPESMLLFELINTDPESLRSAVEDSELATAIRPLFQAWGSDL